MKGAAERLKDHTNAFVIQEKNWMTMDIPAIVSDHYNIVVHSLFRVAMVLLHAITPTEECGHLRAPEGIEVDYRIVASELQKAVLSCSEDKVFPGGKTTITQYCLQGHWEYEEKPNATDIPGCQGEQTSLWW